MRLNSSNCPLCLIASNVSLFQERTKCSSVPKQSIQRLYLCAPSVDVQSIEEGSSGSSGKHLEATLGVLDPTDTQDIDQKVEPIHQKVAEERTLWRNIRTFTVQSSLPTDVRYKDTAG